MIVRDSDRVIYGYDIQALVLSAELGLAVSVYLQGRFGGRTIHFEGKTPGPAPFEEKAWRLETRFILGRLLGEVRNAGHWIPKEVFTRLCGQMFMVCRSAYANLEKEVSRKQDIDEAAQLAGVLF